MTTTFGRTASVVGFSAPLQPANAATIARNMRRMLFPSQNPPRDGPTVPDAVRKARPVERAAAEEQARRHRRLELPNPPLVAHLDDRIPVRPREGPARDRH